MKRKSIAATEKPTSTASESKASPQTIWAWRIVEGPVNGRMQLDVKEIPLVKQDKTYYWFSGHHSVLHWSRRVEKTSQKICRTKIDALRRASATVDSKLKDLEREQAALVRLSSEIDAEILENPQPLD
jgi:hypothetical protein